MRFSTSIGYAIHALVFLAVHDGDGAVPVGDVAGAIKVPDSYLRKVFQLLARGDLVGSHRGVKGGFTLSREAGRITLRDVVEAVEGSLPV